MSAAGEERAGGAFDWREEFECEECRAWPGNPPPPIVVVEEQVRKTLELTQFEVSHACFLCLDADGNPHHIPTTVLEWPDGRHQWIPELPPGIRRR